MRRVLLTTAAALVAFAVWVAVSGGFTTHLFGVVLRARAPLRPLIVAGILLAVLAWREPTEAARTCDHALRLSARYAAVVAAAAAMLLAMHAWVNGTFAAAGSDSYGYVSQAYAWRSGLLPQPIRLPLALPFPSADMIQVPLGYRVGYQPHTMVPSVRPRAPVADGRLVECWCVGTVPGHAAVRCASCVVNVSLGA